MGTRDHEWNSRVAGQGFQPCERLLHTIWITRTGPDEGDRSYAARHKVGVIQQDLIGEYGIGV